MCTNCLVSDQLAWWRNGSASDSRSEGCVFKSRPGHQYFYFKKRKENPFLFSTFVLFFSSFFSFFHPCGTKALKKGGKTHTHLISIIKHQRVILKRVVYKSIYYLDKTILEMFAGINDGDWTRWVYLGDAPWLSLFTFISRWRRDVEGCSQRPLFLI